MQELFPEPISGWARVAVDRPIDVAGAGLSYAVPPEIEDIAPGDPVTVPLGRGNTPTAGWVVSIEDQPGSTTGNDQTHSVAANGFTHAG